jgi:hypothetical protein
MGLVGEALEAKKVQGASLNFQTFNLKMYAS